jgi:tRNA dimethylallyltransferase
MKKLLVILGPTATGKSDLAVKLALKHNGEVISADSRQVYKGLNIGTGKITKEEMKGVHHWLLDVISPKETFTVVDWKKLTEEKIKTIFKRSKLPIICGGTGFYIQSVIDGITMPEVPANKTLRKKLENKNLPELLEILNKLDPRRFAEIDQKNPVRLIRAIEIATKLGSVPKINKKKVPYEILQIGLLPENIKEKIYKRLLLRIKKGMVEEAKKLHKKGLTWNRMRELGLEYRFLADFLENKITKEEFISKLEKEIFQYSKRQMTWFKKDKRIKWFKPTETKKIEKEVSNFLNNN